MLDHYWGLIAVLATQLGLVASIARLFVSSESFEKFCERAADVAKKKAEVAVLTVKSKSSLLSAPLALLLWLTAMSVAGAVVLGGPAAMLLIGGKVSRGEWSLFPPKVFVVEVAEHGVFSGIFAFEASLLFLLWAFLIPGHLYADIYVREGLKRPLFPYAVNLLVGIILSTNDSLFVWLIAIGLGVFVFNALVESGRSRRSLRQ